VEDNFRQYHTESLFRQTVRGGSFASTHRLELGEVLKARARGIIEVRGSEWDPACVGKISVQNHAM